MKIYELVCFDMDGVLFSSEGFIGAVYQEAVAHYCRISGAVLDVPGTGRIMEEIGKPVPVIFRNLFPGLADSEAGKISTFVLEGLVEGIHAGRGLLYPEALETLETLQRGGCRISLASNGRVAYLEAILAYYGIRRYFDEVPFVDGRALPDKASLISHAMRRFSVAGGRTLMVGDRLADYEAARQAGCRFALCLHGHGSDFHDEPLDHRIGRLGELPALAGGSPA